MDEITSSLDTKTESSIINEISQLKRDKTIIMSTHRESLLKNCDRVYDVNKRFFYSVLDKNLPVVVFAYNRPKTIKILLTQLKKIKPPNIIFLDGPKNKKDNKKCP